MVTFNIENIPVVSDDSANVPETVEVEINTQELEIEVLDVKQINYCMTQKNGAKQKNWFECEHCKKGFCKFNSFLASLQHSTNDCITIKFSKFLKCCSTALEKSLTKHIEFAHNGRTLHLCNVCGQLCSHESSLKSHMLQHQGNAVY